jgi:hypothetical protein
MNAKPKKSEIKVAKKTEDASSISTKGTEGKLTFCKEFECGEKSQVSGYCRLHFLKLVKGNTAAGQARAQDKESSEEKSVRRWDRSPKGRPSGFESTEEVGTSARAEFVEKLGTLDADLTSILDGEDLDPFKKAG